MSTDARLTLREVAGRLSGYRQFKETRTRGRQELLKLLQADEIRAAFYFPSAAKPRILIPAEWWLDVPSGRFQSKLTWNSQRGQRRQFLVEPAKFAGPYAAWFAGNYPDRGRSAETAASVSAELASALINMNKKREVYILESEWGRFVRDAGLEKVEHHDEPGKLTKGRRPLEAWEVVLVEVASELLARQALGLSLEEQQSTIAAVALSRAEKLKKGASFPEIETVTKKIRQILDGRDVLQKNLSESPGHGS
jgi:hypothetical protein